MKSLSLAALLFVACGIPKQNQQAPRDGFQYDVNGETVAIIYETNAAPASQQVDIQIQVNEHQFDFGMNAETGLQSIDGHGAVLNAAERDALAKAAKDYATRENVNDSSPLEQRSVYLAFDYLSHAPDNYAFPSRRFNNLSLANEGISCIRKGTTVTAQWNTQASSYVAENIVVGVNWPNGYGCMGRCGADCGWGAPSSWTKDCLDHDACSYRNNASGGSSDPNCGDEYDEAADDWMGGVWWGCNGN
jgi:hypothetical protein